MMNACSLVNVPLDWEALLSWGANVLQGKGLRATLGRLSLGASIYHIWRQMNDLLHHNIPRSEEAMLVQIKWEVRVRLLANGKYKWKNVELAARWNV